jgi:ferredoxin
MSRTTGRTARHENGSMRIAIDLDRCVGAGQCVLAADEVFDQSEEDGRVVLLANRPAADLEPPVRNAAYLCPAGAIDVHED